MISNHTPSANIQPHHTELKVPHYHLHRSLQPRKHNQIQNIKNPSPRLVQCTERIATWNQIRPKHREQTCQLSIATPAISKIINNPQTIFHIKKQPLKIQTRRKKPN
jgi:hypothetical protein